MDIHSRAPSVDELTMEGFEVKADLNPEGAFMFAQSYLKEGVPVVIVTKSEVVHNDPNYVVLTGDKNHLLQGNPSITAEKNGHQVMRQGIQTDISGIVRDLVERGSFQINLYNLNHKQYTPGADPELLVTAIGARG